MNSEELKELLKDYEPVGEAGFHHFAILVPVIDDSEGLKLLYEVRAAGLKRQPGEVCFPGGLIEEGETPLECALRETCEEVGISPENVTVMARIDTVFSTGGSQLHCFAGLIEQDAFSKMKPNEDEVAETFTVPVAELLEAEPEMYYSRLIQEPDENFPYDRITGGKMYPWREGRSPVPVYDIGGRIIWGLTGRITRQFMEILRREVQDV